MQPNPSASATRAAKLLIWVIPLLWVVNSFIARRAVDVITPHVLAWGRWALAGVILAWVTRAELWQHRQALRTHTRRYLLLGACGMWICGAAVYFAGQTTTMMNISLIYAASPVMIAVGSVLWLREPFSKRQALGVVLALVGVVHVVVQGQWLLLTQVVFVPGDLWIAAAATAWAAYSMMQKHWGNPIAPAPNWPLFAPVAWSCSRHLPHGSYCKAARLWARKRWPWWSWPRCCRACWPIGFMAGPNPSSAPAR